MSNYDTKNKNIRFFKVTTLYRVIPLIKWLNKMTYHECVKVKNIDADGFHLLSLKKSGKVVAFIRCSDTDLRQIAHAVGSDIARERYSL